jgi:hypothetical protein
MPGFSKWYVPMSADPVRFLGRTGSRPQKGGGPVNGQAEGRKTMAKHHRRPRWQSVERVVRLFVSVAYALSQLIDSLSRVH